MSKRDRIEIVQTSAEQPWSIRIFRNEQTFRSSENYTRKVGAERALVGLAKMFGWEGAALVTDEGGAWLWDVHNPDYPKPISVVYLVELDPVLDTPTSKAKRLAKSVEDAG